ncbi:MAG: cobalamin B12-binding domain-containing protein [Janthinobacterium lividum]
MASVHQPEQFRGHERRSPEASPLRMARLIEGEIIPRLLMAHRAAPVELVTPPVSFTAVEPLELAHMSLRLEVFSLLAHIDAYLANGVPIESVYLDLLAPTARVLGDFWDNDVCDFVDVTMGLWRLQQVVHELGSRAPCPSGRTRADRRVLFTVPPGDQHSFGLVMIEDFFRRAGWRTWSAPDAGMPELCAIAGRQWFELIGLTVSNVESLTHLPAIFRDLRRASQNPAVGIMVGGKIFSDHPELAERSGADATAVDGAMALLAAERLVDRLAHRGGATA